MERLLLLSHFLCSVLRMVHLSAQYGGLRGGRSVTKVGAHTHSHTHKNTTYTVLAKMLLLQLRTEDGVHPSQVSSFAAAAGLGKSGDGCD